MSNTATIITNLVIDFLASRRLTRLVIEDEITQEFREWIHNNPNIPGKVKYLITCPWCVSIYTAALVTLTRKHSPQLNTILASSQVTGLMAERYL